MKFLQVIKTNKGDSWAYDQVKHFSQNEVGAVTLMQNGNIVKL